jgi:SWIM/SEC-C metal-binding protein
LPSAPDLEKAVCSISGRPFPWAAQRGLLNTNFDPLEGLSKGGKMEKVFDGKKPAKLGTEKNPAVVTVKTKKKRKEVASIFEKAGWKYTIEVDRNKSEDLTDLEILENWPKTREVDKPPGRNDPCICGSGKKYKKCCGP